MQLRGKRKKIFFGVLSLLLLMTFVHVWRSRPFYHGKSAKSWLRQATFLGEGGKRHEEAMTAFQQMGTNAYPFLLDSLAFPSYEAMTNHIARDSRLYHIPYLGFWLEKEEWIDWREPAVWVVKNSDSGAIMPMIYERLLGQTNRQVRLALLQSLLDIMPVDTTNEVQTLTSVLADPNPKVRDFTLEVLGDISTGVSNALPAISNACKDPDPLVRGRATNLLRQITSQP
jgi:HEAT repeats